MNSTPKSGKLPPMSRPLKIFSLCIFAFLFLAVVIFMWVNPLALDFLPGAGTSSEMHEPGTSDGAHASMVYQCPMHPEVMEAEPGSCPICGMQLMPRDLLVARAEQQVAAASATPGTGEAITIDPIQVQNTGVVSVAAYSGEIARSVRTVGILDFNADRISWVNTKFSGWVEAVKVSYVGQTVKTGETLFEIYSPELVTTQDEYLRATNYADSLRLSGRPEALKQAESLLRSTRERLQYWGITQQQIEDLETRRTTSRRLPIVSPVDGVVVEVMDEALEGMFVEPGMNLYKIADMSSVWVHADVYESDLPWVRAGQPAEVSFSYDPDTHFAGEILFLYPQVSQETRTLKICIQVPNDSGDLRAGMYSDVLIKGPSIQDAILVPNSSILRSGERDLVFIDQGGGRFQPREVKLGIRGERDVIQILSGVESGEKVVTQGQFMMDSESRVQEAIAQFLDRRPQKPAPDEAASPAATPAGKGD